jgi:hypothetical protein
MRRGAGQRRSARTDLALGDGDAGGGLLVAGEEGEEVVRPAMAGLDNEGEVGGEAAVVGVAGLVLVLVRALDVVGELARALEHGAGVVGPVLVLLVGSERLGLVLSVADADEVAEGDALHSVACGTHLCVDLVSTANAVG